MSKILNVYKDNVDRTWYQSSNIKYSECVDHDNALKTLRVVFNNGTQYEYKDVDVNQYLLFREDASQGKALNKYIKGNSYPYEKIDDANMNALEDELNFRSEGGYYIHLVDGNTVIEDSFGNEVFSSEGVIDSIGLEAVTKVLQHLSHDVKVKK